MTMSIACISTSAANRYLRQLCHHFEAVTPEKNTDVEGLIILPFGACRLAAQDGLLTLTATAKSADMPRLEQVIGDHLSRFAFRERPTITWQRAA